MMKHLALANHNLRKVSSSYKISFLRYLNPSDLKKMHHRALSYKNLWKPPHPLNYPKPMKTHPIYHHAQQSYSPHHLMYIAEWKIGNLHQSLIEIPFLSCYLSIQMIY